MITDPNKNTSYIYYVWWISREKEAERVNKIECPENEKQNLYLSLSHCDYFPSISFPPSKSIGSALAHSHARSYCGWKSHICVIWRVSSWKYALAFQKERSWILYLNAVVHFRIDNITKRHDNATINKMHTTLHVTQRRWLISNSSNTPAEAAAARRNGHSRKAVANRLSPTTCCCTFVFLSDLLLSFGWRVKINFRLRCG